MVEERKPVDEAALKEEIVDIFHFYLSMCLVQAWTRRKCIRFTCVKTRKTSRVRKAKAKSPVTRWNKRPLFHDKYVANCFILETILAFR